VVPPSVVEQSGDPNAVAVSASDALQPGDYVRLKGQQTVGEVLSVNGRQVQVAFGMIKSMVDFARLEKVSRNQLKKEQNYTNGIGALLKDSETPVEVMSSRRSSFKQQLDVRGMRADEALQAVMYYMDDAILLSVSQVRILHGTGTGALRQAIRQYLSTLPGIKDFHDEHVQFGGSGITVVELDN
jgi:DNA mismatch repair protein MutS2